MTAATSDPMSATRPAAKRAETHARGNGQQFKWNQQEPGQHEDADPDPQR